MLTSAYRKQRKERQGVILILVLGVLGLMALIGVTFATFTGQARVSGRNFAQSKIQPQREEMMDFALSQLISDTADVRSAIRGHSLARDMYGNDARLNGYLEARPDGAITAPGNNSWFYITQSTASGAFYDLTTNIASNDPVFYGYDFTRWLIRVAYTGPLAGGGTGAINQTFEVIADSGFDSTVTTARVLRVVITPSDISTALVNPIPPATPIFKTQSPALYLTNGTNLAANCRFILDGRWLRAFNGPGMGADAKYGNFRYNGLTPGAIGMDEDYDAADLENWFLAVQSADGSVVIPSFHRPAVIRYDPAGLGGTVLNDWALSTPDSMSRILRPRQADGHDPQSFPDLIPSADNGKITYDVDNDGDGVTDSVWVDLGYPARRNAKGQLYKPLFSFMVIGLNGKLPLNTAANLAGRGASGASESTHASHLGNSVSEVDITYGLQNGYEPVQDSNLAFNPPPGGAYNTQVDNAGIDVRLTQLRNLLAGTRPQLDPYKPDTSVNGDANFVAVKGDAYYMPNGIADPLDIDISGNNPPTDPVVRATDAVPGRWGEAEAVPGGILTGGSWINALAPAYKNPVRAGYSLNITDLIGTGIPRDAADDNYNSFDVWPARTTGEIGDADSIDVSGALTLPVERMRRFLTPVDLNGTGDVRRWNGGSGLGNDLWGRVEHRGYFRPPGLPGQVDPITGAVTFPWVDAQTYPGSVVTQANVTMASPSAHNNNILHGYESFRFPNLPGQPQRAGGTLVNMNGNGSGRPVTLPTYNNEVNSSDTADGQPNSRSDGLNEADELNLYERNANLDAPFTNSDLEWLYRKHDIDGDSLNSRLSSLAPISFNNPQDSLRRRRLYATETWEPNNFVWSNDNPGGAFVDNKRFTATANASMLSQGPAFYTPSLAQRDKKINLNMPLPVSNNPNEPIRQKWISDTYTLMKQVLPPRAIDTPEERAQLSQFIINIVDFRDTDSAMTHWVNPDVFFIPSTGAGVNPSLSFTGTVPLHQYGMEYNPIAINEVLAYSFKRKEGNPGAPVVTPRFFIELVNTLSRPETGTDVNNASILNLSGYAATGAPDPWSGGCWDLVFTDDATNSRPDPYLGQLQPGATLYGLTPLVSTAITVPGGDVQANPLERTPGNSLTNWFGNGTGINSYFLTIGNTWPGAGAETDGETNPATPVYRMAATYDPVSLAAGAPGGTIPLGVLPPTTAGGTGVQTYPAKIPAPVTAGEARYYWVCLRRPANPMAPVTADNPMVVVDSMRFPYIESGGTGVTDAAKMPPKQDTVTQGANWIFSYQRLQPYRGGHAVPAAAGGGIDPRYGYTEQIAVPITNSGNYLNYGTTATQVDSTPGPRLTPNAVYHTLGLPNDGSVTAGTPPTVLEPWDYFPFHDRDFTSIHELTLVPGCPPGLFTKQFAEFAPSADNVTSFTAAAAGTLATVLPSPVVLPAIAGTTPASANASNRFMIRGDVSPVEPHTFPYLVDKFFYTAAGYAGVSAVDTLNTTVGGYASDGWHRMLEFFEVPSQMNGAIEPVMKGTNFDWARQDFKPGLLNLNLILDEEVFFGLLGKQSMTGSPPSFQQQLMNPHQIPSANPEGFTEFTGGVWPGPLPLAADAPLTTGYPTIPMVVTSTLSNGAPGHAYPMRNIGYLATDPDHAAPFDIGNRMKASFAQFLWLRHGGSGFIFGYGEGATGQNLTVRRPDGTTSPGGAIPSERPFRSSSYPDVNLTVMRPAALPPSTVSDPVLNDVAAGYANDPGVRNRFMFPGYATGVAGPLSTAAATVMPPAIPARRLFQIPDAKNSGTGRSNASENGDPYINNTRPVTVGNPAIGAMPSVTINGATVNLTNGDANIVIPGGSVAGYPNPELGSTPAAGTPVVPDLRQHPYFRSEMMQRVMNLTTVRSHQYAVWITVGFFEVKREGDVAMRNSSYPTLGFDQIGAEIGASTGETNRFRSFFVVDRLKLTGYDPATVGGFRPAVVYRRNIE